MTIYLGIDPGYDRCGYAVIDTDLTVITYGVIQTKSEWPYWQRLNVIYDAICDVITGCRVQVAGMEKPFIGNNLRYGVEVAGVWGAIGLATRQNNCQYLELTTTQVKAAVSGGRATKEEVKRGVETILGQTFSGPDDITDAMAVAICTRDKQQFAQMVKEGS